MYYIEAIKVLFVFNPKQLNCEHNLSCRGTGLALGLNSGINADKKTKNIMLWFCNIHLNGYVIFLLMNYYIFYILYSTIIIRVQHSGPLTYEFNYS